jgi:hypothetical protein
MAGCGGDVSHFALTSMLAGFSSLPCLLHLMEVMFLVWKRSSARMRTCCSATSEFLNVERWLLFRKACFLVLRFGCDDEEGWKRLWACVR